MNIQSRKRIIIILVLVATLVAIISGAYYWLKMPYGFPLQRQLATDFIDLVNHHEFEKAFELTHKNIYTGKTLEDFTNKAQREIRGANYRFDYTFPPQTNGNRLRRWLKGQKVDMQDVSIEFKGPSDLRITVRHLGNNQWKVFYITSHAG